MPETEIIEFGAGKIGVLRTSEAGEDFQSGLAFVHQEAHAIGTTVSDYIGKTTDEVGCFLRFHFSNAESVQVLIDDLILVRDSIKSFANQAHVMDPLIDAAKDIARKEGYASVTLLQRKMRIGYTRAARLMDYLIEEKFIDDKGSRHRHPLADPTWSKENG